MKTMTIKITTSGTESIEIISGDILAIECDGQVAFVRGDSLIAALVNSEEWNSRIVDAKTGVATSINELLQTTHP
jgi:hypothetical protein